MPDNLVVEKAVPAYTRVRVPESLNIAQLCALALMLNERKLEVIFGERVPGDPNENETYNLDLYEYKYSVAGFTSPVAAVMAHFLSQKNVGHFAFELIMGRHNNVNGFLKGGQGSIATLVRGACDIGRPPQEIVTWFGSIFQTLFRITDFWKELLLCLDGIQVNEQKAQRLFSLNNFCKFLKHESDLVEWLKRLNADVASAHAVAVNEMPDVIRAGSTFEIEIEDLKFLCLFVESENPLVATYIMRLISSDSVDRFMETIFGHEAKTGKYAILVVKKPKTGHVVILTQRRYVPVNLSKVYGKLIQSETQVRTDGIPGEKIFSWHPEWNLIVNGGRQANVPPTVLSNHVIIGILKKNVRIAADDEPEK